MLGRNPDSCSPSWPLCTQLTQVLSLLPSVMCVVLFDLYKMFIMKIEKKPGIFSKLVLISPNNDTWSSTEREKYSHFVKFCALFPYRLARCLALGTSNFAYQNYR